MSTIIICSACGAVSKGGDPIDDRTCPRCGGGAVKVSDSLEINDTGPTAFETISSTIKDPSRPSREKARQRFKAADELSRDRGTRVWREWSADRDRNLYKEKVTDLETGEIIHECDEPLSEHRGHGRDKHRNNKITNDADRE
ncbi:MAG TPA: hypothetical protein VFX92_06340 [Candidatus Krumholzibacteria bacterium]|nr:hypothetical protein [Candidatus Krumholzibacteria bacterium]